VLNRLQLRVELERQERDQGGVPAVFYSVRSMRPPKSFRAKPTDCAVTGPAERRRDAPPPPSVSMNGAGEFLGVLVAVSANHPPTPRSLGRGELLTGRVAACLCEVLALGVGPGMAVFHPGPCHEPWRRRPFSPVSQRVPQPEA